MVFSAYKCLLMGDMDGLAWLIPSIIAMYSRIMSRCCLWICSIATKKKKKDVCISLMFTEQKLTGSTENCYSFFGTLGPDWFCNLIYITRRFSLGADVAYYVSPDWDPFAVLIVILFWYRNGFDNFYTSKIS